MQEDNKVIWITIIITIVTIVGIFVMLVASTPEPISDDAKLQYLIREDSHVLGSSNITDEMVVFEDFQCPACVIYHEEFKKIREGNPNLRYVFRHLPLVSIHPLAMATSNAVEAAGAQGKFYEYHDVLYENHAEWSELSNEKLTKKLIEFAEKVGISDIEQFKDDLSTNKYFDKIERDVSDVEKLGVNATPTVFINGQKVLNPTFENIQKLLQGE